MNLPERPLVFGRKKSCIRELTAYGAIRKKEIGADKVYDFSLGNPSILPPKEVNEAIIKVLSEKENVVHGYTPAIGIEPLRIKIAEHLNKIYDVNLTADNIFVTTGAAAALIISFKALCLKDDEIITIAPYYPDYTVYTEGGGAKLVVVESKEDFSIDIEKIEKAINEHTRAILINSPNNPAGVIYREDELKDLAKMLERKEKELGRSLYILSDEPYRELVYTGEKIHSPIEYYDHTLVCYSWSKSLSLPGERIGYIAVNNKANNAGEIYTAIKGAARLTAYVNPPSLIQYAMVECIDTLVDVNIYKKNRELLMNSLKEIGYEFAPPDGAFYLFVKALEPDSQKFSDKAKELDLLIVPGAGFGRDGYVRLAYCVSYEMIERSIPVFKKLYDSYKK